MNGHNQEEAAEREYMRMLFDRMASLETERRRLKSVLLAWDSWMLLGLFAAEIAALSGYLGVVDWWNLQYDSAPQLLFSSLRFLLNVYG